MIIKKATFLCVNGDKSALDRLNDFIVENKISKCDVLNIETSTDCEGTRCLILYYWESV